MFYNKYEKLMRQLKKRFPQLDQELEGIKSDAGKPRRKDPPSKKGLLAKIGTALITWEPFDAQEVINHFVKRNGTEPIEVNKEWLSGFGLALSIVHNQTPNNIPLIQILEYMRDGFEISEEIPQVVRNHVEQQAEVTASLAATHNDNQQVYTPEGGFGFFQEIATFALKVYQH